MLMLPLHKFFLMPFCKQFILLYTLILLCFIRVGLKYASFKDLLSWLAKSNSITKLSSPPTINTLVWAVHAASRLQPGGVKCLARSLAMQHLLAQYGYLANLKIGVMKAASGELEAHAWVEYQGKVIIGALDNLLAFTPLM